MALWIAMAVLAAGACVPLLVALGRGAPAMRSASGQAMAIYRDQLAEVGRDVDRGVIAGSEAEAARTEIARRLIHEGEAAPATTPAGRRPNWATAAIVAMPIAALALYLFTGSPHLPDEPLASRPDAVAQQEVSRLVAAVEAHLAAVPDDGKGWEVIAPVYARLGRNADAVHAYARVVALLGSTAEREANLGEAMVRVSDGAVSLEAEAAFERARALAPTDPKPRFYLALAMTQAGRVEEAKEAWRALLRDGPQDAAWVPAAKAQLAALETPVGPSTDDVAAAADLPPAERQQMIEGMVASLATRLEAEPGDAEGWARLVRSYVVLGRATDATAALARARTALAGDPAKLATVDAVARELGLAEATP